MAKDYGAKTTVMPKIWTYEGKKMQMDLHQKMYSM
jgi:hypothetical protein